MNRSRKPAHAKLQEDVARLEGLAYHRLECSGDLIESFHGLSKAAKAHPAFPALELLYDWLFVPITLWPIDLEGLFRAILVQVIGGKRLTKEMRLLLDLLPSQPGETTIIATKEHEHAVQAGNYEQLMRAQHKFDNIETALARDPAFNADWAAIKARFAVKRYEDHKGIIRRRLIGERSMRTDWGFQWRRPADRFREVFDVFCQKWNLYGMNGNRPLLMKLTVNLTPFGTMIFVPAYWSFDPKRDLSWRAITSLHKARGVRKQGPKLGASQLSQRDEAEKARRLWANAAKLGLRGEARASWMMKELGWDPRTDPRTLRRLRAERPAR